MKVFKFDGASVKDVDSVKNIANVLKTNGFNDCFMVISAMGKMTNALEEVIKLYFEAADFQTHLDQIKQNHFQVIDGLFENPDKIKSKIQVHFDETNRSEEHTSELQSRENLVCRLLLEKKKKTK